MGIRHVDVVLAAEVILEPFEKMFWRVFFQTVNRSGNESQQFQPVQKFVW